MLLGRGAGWGRTRGPAGAGPVPAARGGGRHCTPWSGCGSGCLARERGTNCAEGVVMVLAEQADPVVVFAVISPRGTSLLRHPNKIIITNKL